MRAGLRACCPKESARCVIGAPRAARTWEPSSLERGARRRGAAASRTRLYARCAGGAGVSGS